MDRVGDRGGIGGAFGSVVEGIVAVNWIGIIARIGCVVGIDRVW